MKFLLALALAVTAVAQPQVCPADVAASRLSDGNVVIDTSETNWLATTAHEASVSVAGRVIRISRELDVNSIAVLEHGGSTCFTRSVDAGPLAEGRYLVLWTTTTHDFDVTVETRAFPLLVGPVPAALACPDNAIIDVVPAQPEEGSAVSVRLAALEGVAYKYSEPNVVVKGSEIVATQFVDRSGAHPPPIAICNSHILSVGNLAPGRYRVTWEIRDISGPLVVTRGPFAFDVKPRPACTPAASVVLGRDGSYELRYDGAFVGYALQFGTPQWTRSGNTIRVRQETLETTHASAIDVPLRCHSEKITLGALEPGTYWLKWEYVRSFDGGVPETISTSDWFDFTIKAPTRQRAARH